MGKVRGVGSARPALLLQEMGLKNALCHGLNAGVGVYLEPVVVEDVVLELAMFSGAVPDLADIA
jgi:hypothetical protein